MFKKISDWIKKIMKKIISKIKFDKLLHFICGLLISQIFFGAICFALPVWASLAISIGIVAVVGALKEWWDVKNGEPSWGDFAADMIGAVVGNAISLLVYFSAI